MEQSFNPERLIERLAYFPGMLSTLIGQISGEEARARSPEGGWAIVEIVAHLADEEAADFPARLRALLEAPGREWEPIDPEAWARDRRYIERDLRAEYARFTDARRENLAWIRYAAGEADWDLVRHHPLGDLRAGDLLAAWCDHDILHARQIIKRLHELIIRDAGPYSPAYAGEWKA